MYMVKNLLCLCIGKMMRVNRRDEGYRLDDGEFSGILIDRGSSFVINDTYL